MDGINGVVFGAANPPVDSDTGSNGIEQNIQPDANSNNNAVPDNENEAAASNPPRSFSKAKKDLKTAFREMDNFIVNQFNPSITQLSQYATLKKEIFKIFGNIIDNSLDPLSKLGLMSQCIEKEMDNILLKREVEQLKLRNQELENYIRNPKAIDHGAGRPNGMAQAQPNITNAESQTDERPIMSETGTAGEPSASTSASSNTTNDISQLQILSVVPVLVLDTNLPSTSSRCSSSSDNARAVKRSNSEPDNEAKRPRWTDAGGEAAGTIKRKWKSPVLNLYSCAREIPITSLRSMIGTTGNRAEVELEQQSKSDTNGASSPGTPEVDIFNIPSLVNSGGSNASIHQPPLQMAAQLNTPAPVTNNPSISNSSQENSQLPAIDNSKQLIYETAAVRKRTSLLSRLHRYSYDSLFRNAATATGRIFTVSDLETLPQVPAQYYPPLVQTTQPITLPSCGRMIRSPRLIAARFWPRY